jgi:ankyrin repeat protein
MLLQSPDADATIKNQGCNALHMACSLDRVSAVTQILDRWPNLVNVATDYGWHPICIAAQAGHLDVIKALLAKQDPNVSLLLNNIFICFIQ